MSSVCVGFEKRSEREFKLESFFTRGCTYVRRPQLGSSNRWVTLIHVFLKAVGNTYVWRKRLHVGGEVQDHRQAATGQLLLCTMSKLAPVSIKPIRSFFLSQIDLLMG